MIGTRRIFPGKPAEALTRAYDLDEAQRRADRILLDQPDVQRVEVVRRWRVGRDVRNDVLEVRGRDESGAIVSIE